jgi:hypothetical protein
MSATELERLVVRGREIVARQRELAAKLGNEFPIAGALLETYEKSLALFEDYRRQEVLAKPVDEAVGGSSALLVASYSNCPSPDDTTVPKQDHQDRMRGVVLVMEILRDAGYQCELAKETLH